MGWLVVLPSSEPEIVRRVFNDSYCRIDMMGNQDVIKLGNPLFLGGGPGLFGGGESRVLTPGAFDMTKRIQGHISERHARPARVQALVRRAALGPEILERLNLSFVLQVDRTISFTAAARAANATPGVPAFSPPTATGDEGTYMEFMVYLDCVQLGSRSRNR